MFCQNCGKEIGTGMKFCPHCGARRPDFSGGNVPGGNMPGGSSSGSSFERAGDEIGRGIDEAVNDFRDGARSFEKSLEREIGAAENSAAEIGKGWQDYLTPENIEMVAAAAPLLPLCMAVVCFAVSFITRFFWGIPLLGTVIRFIPRLLRFAFVAASAAGVAAAIYTLVVKDEKRNLWGGITCAAAALSFFSCLGMMLRWEKIPLILGIISVIWGIDAVSRGIIQRKGIETPADPAADLAAYGSFAESLKARRTAAGGAGAGYDAASGGAGGSGGYGAAAGNGAGAGYGTYAAYGAPAGQQGVPPYGGGPAQGYYQGGSAQSGSYFDGDGTELFGLMLLTALLGGVTCGIAVPWMLCKIYTWRKSHTVIDGRRLGFNGTGGDLIGHWILWEVLCIVTCGIYIFFMHVALLKWEMQHTFYADQPNVPGQFDGNSVEYFGYGLIQGLLLLVTCGLAAPWTVTMITKWQMQHTVIAGNRMRYDGSASELLPQYLLVLMLSAVTCGIYSAWGTVRLNKYTYSHTHADSMAAGLY